jgi:hypothetical protein
MIARSVTSLAAVGAGLAWLTWEALRFFWDGSTGSDCASGAEYAGDTAFATAGVLTGLTLLGLSSQANGLARTSALLGAAGATLFGLGNAAEHCAFEPLFALYAAGGLAFVVSTTAFGLSVLVTGALGRWPGVLLIAAALAPMILSFEHSGAAVGGAAWLILGIALLVVRSATLSTASQPRAL